VADDVASELLTYFPTYSIFIIV